MSVFDRKSRYVRFSSTGTAVDRRGRMVAYVLPAEVPEQDEIGLHRRRQGQRLDHLAAHYLGDPTAFWRIVELADVMTVEQIVEADLVPIPTRRI